MDVVKDQLAKSLQALRVGKGLTAEKLESHPLLVHMLDVNTTDEGFEKLDELSNLITDEKYWKEAVRNALAIGYEPGAGPVDRRERVAKEIPLSPRQVQRYEDEGFEILADIIIERSPSSLDKKRDAFTDLSQELSPLLPAVTDEEPPNQTTPDDKDAEEPVPHSKLLTRWQRFVRSDTFDSLAFGLFFGSSILLGVGASYLYANTEHYKNRQTAEVFRETYAHLDAKEPQYPILAMEKVSVAGSGQPSADESQGWGPKRPTFTMKKPAPYPVLNSITNHDRHGDERNFLQCRDNGIWTTAIQADSGHVYQCYLWFDNAVAPNLDNGNSAARLQNTRVSIRQVKGSQGMPSLVGTLSANNSVSVWSSCLFSANEPLTITYQRGTAHMQLLPYDNSPGLYLAEKYKGDTMVSGIATPSGALLGEKKLDGTVGQNAGYILFDVKVGLG